MKEKLQFLGLDVHAETIAAAIAEPDGEVRSLGTIPNRMESIRKLVKKLGSVDKLRACYEAGPTGYVVYWQMAELGVKCEVIAPRSSMSTGFGLVVKSKLPMRLTLRQATGEMPLRIAIASRSDAATFCS
jgi:hypothetical protein